MIETISIYGVFNRRGLCLYVGQTRNPQGRWQQIRKKLARLGIKSCRFEVFRRVKGPAAPKAESRMIKAFKAAGECRLNKITAPRNHEAATQLGCPVRVAGRNFASKSQAGRMLGYPTLARFQKAINAGFVKLEAARRNGFHKKNCRCVRCEKKRAEK